MKLYEREYTHTRTHNHTHTQALFFVCVLFTVNYFNLVVIVGAVFFSLRNSSTKCVHNTSIEYIRLPKHSFKLEFLNCAVANTQTVVSFAANTEITLKNSDIRAYICVSAVQRTQTAPMCAWVHSFSNTCVYAYIRRAYTRSLTRFGVQSNSPTYRFASSPVFCALRILSCFIPLFLSLSSLPLLPPPPSSLPPTMSWTFFFFRCMFVFSLNIAHSFHLNSFHSHTHAFALVHSIISFHFMVNAWNIHANWK